MRRLTAQLALHLTTASRTDGELLAAFVSAGTEADFAELVRRHGPLVWGVCRRALPDFADAEDAFQAVFLVLLRRANRLTAYSTIGPWLHRVAVWTAKNVRRRNARRLAKRTPLSDHIATTPTDPDLPLDLDAALLSLPDKYRSPVVLCHLLGYSRTEAAHKLGCPEGTLSAWLSRGLAKLRAKLGGYDPAKALAVAAVAVPTGLSASVVRTAVASQVSAATTSAVSHIVEGVLHMFWVKKATAASAALVAVFALGMGVGLTARQGVGVAEAQVKTDDKSPAKPTTTPTIDEQIAKLEADLLAAETSLNVARTGLKLTEEKIALYKDRGGVAEAEQLNDKITRARFLESEIEAMRRFVDLSLRLNKLKRTRDSLRTRAEKYDADLKALSEALKAKEAEYDAKQVTRHAIIEATLAELAALRKPADALQSGAYLELTLRGEVAKFDFVIRETDASGKLLGTVTVTGPEMLAKILARTKADPTAPKELRLTAEPPTAHGGGPSVLFKACDAAGYKTVKFTGYMPQHVLDLPELKPDQRGDVEGYQRYENAEVSTSVLIKQIEVWLTLKWKRGG